MFKKILSFILMFFFLACSNNYVQKDFFEKNIDTLNKFSLSIKNNLEQNNFDFLKENSVKNIKNNYILKQIEKIDFSDVDIFLSKVSLKEKYPSSIMAIHIYNENTFYFELSYIYDYHSAKWLIYEVKEKGENSDLGEKK